MQSPLSFGLRSDTTNTREMKIRRADAFAFIKLGPAPRRGAGRTVPPWLGLAPLSGVREHPTRFSGGRSPLALNDDRLPSGNPPGWPSFQPAGYPHSRKWWESSPRVWAFMSSQPEGLPDGSRKSPRGSWGGDFRATAQNRACTPAGCQTVTAKPGRATRSSSSLIPSSKQEAMVAPAHSSDPLLPRPHPDHRCLAIGLRLDPVSPHRQFNRAL